MRILTHKLNEQEAARVARALRAKGIFVLKDDIKTCDSVLNIVRFFRARAPQARARICDIICDAIGVDRVTRDFWELRLTEEQAQHASNELRWRGYYVSAISLKNLYTCDILGYLTLEERVRVYEVVQKVLHQR